MRASVWISFIISVLLLALAIACLASVAVQANVLPRRAIVTAVDCADWAERKADNGAPIWYATAGRVETYRGWRKVSGDVTVDSPELWHVLEWTCAPEFGAGVGNVFGPATIDYLVPHLGD